MKNIRPRHLFSALLAIFLLASFTRPSKKAESNFIENNIQDIKNIKLLSDIRLGTNSFQQPSFSIIKSSEQVPTVAEIVNSNFISNATQVFDAKVASVANKVIEPLPISISEIVSNKDSVTKTASVSDKNTERLFNEVIAPISILPVKLLPISTSKKLIGLNHILGVSEYNLFEKEYFRYDSTSHSFKKIDNIKANMGLDPVRFRLKANKDSVAIGEEFEIKITAEFLDVSPGLIFQFEGSNGFTLKMLLPDNFVQTGGTYYDFIQGKITRQSPKQEFIIKGYFESMANRNEFKLLRGPVGADANAFYYLAEKLVITQKYTTTASKAEVKAPIDDLTLSLILRSIPPARAIYDNPCPIGVYFSNGPYCQGVGFLVNVIGCGSSPVSWYFNGAPLYEQTTYSFVAYEFGTYQALCFSGCATAGSISPTIDVDISVQGETVACGAQGTLTVQGCTSGIHWSTGQRNTETITVSPGTYSVTCITICGNSHTANGTINTFTGPPAPTFLSTPSCGSTIVTGSCYTGNFTWVTGGNPFTNTGTYRGRCTDSNNCFTEENVDVTVYPKPSPPKFSGYNTNGNFVCNPTTISGSCEVGQFSWEAGETGLVTYSKTLNGSCLLNGCRTYGGVSITYYPNPSTPSNPTLNQSLCEGSSLLLTGSCDGGITPVWSSNTPRDLRIYTGGTYTITCANECNTIGFSHSIIITNLPKAKFPYVIGGGRVCDTNPVTMQIEDDGVVRFSCNGTIKWYKSDDPNYILSTESSYTTNVAGTYYAECKTDCTTEKSNPITVYSESSPTQITVYGNTQICGSQTTSLGYNGCLGTNIQVKWQRYGVDVSSVDGVGAGEYTAICSNPCGNNSATITVTNVGTCFDLTTTRACNTISFSYTGCSSANDYVLWSTSSSFNNSIASPISITTETTIYARCMNGSTIKDSDNTGSIYFENVPPQPDLSYTTATICSGANIGFPYVSNCPGTLTWSPSTINNIAITNSTNTTYTATCSKNGCVSSSNSFTVTVNPVPVITGGGPVCDKIVVVSQSPASQATLYQNDIAIATANFAGTSAEFANRAKGTYYVTIKNAYNCTSAPSGPLQVGSNVPTIAFDTDYSGTICSNPPNNFTKIKPTATCSPLYTFKWENNSTTTLRTITSAGTYYGKCVNDDGNCALQEQSNTLTVNVITPTVPTSMPTSFTPVCKDQTVNLYSLGGTCSSGTTIKWYKASDNTLVSGKFQAVSTASYYARCAVIGVATCESSNSASLSLTVNPLPVLVSVSTSPNTPPGSDCNAVIAPVEGGTITFNANFSPGTGVTYVWKNPAGVVVTAMGSNPASITNAATTDTGIYTVTATLGSCTATATTSVTVYPKCGLRFASNPVVSACTNGAVGSTIAIAACGDLNRTELLLQYKLEKKDVNGVYRPFLDWTTGGALNRSTSNFTIPAKLAGSYRVFIRTKNPNSESQVQGCFNASDYRDFEIVCPCNALNSISYERWNNITGDNVADLTTSVKFQETPDASSNITTYFEAPRSIGDNYGVRMRGYICPPTTGAYTFWVQADDSAVLFLSSDDNPNNKVRIAYIISAAPYRDYKAYPTQQSVPITLTQNKKYYIEALMKQGIGGDDLSIAWRKPTDILDPTTPIPTQDYLSPFTDCYIIINANTPKNEVVAGQSVLLSANGGGTGATYAWKIEGTTIGTGASITVNPTETTTYTVTCTNCSNNACVDGRIKIEVPKCIKLTATHSDLSLYAEVAGTNSAIKQGNYTGAAEQVWELVRNTDNTVKIRSYSYEKYIENNGSILLLGSIGSANNQSWNFNSTPSGFYSIQHPSMSPATVFDVQSVSTSPGAPIFLWTKGSLEQGNQTFKSESVDCPVVPTKNCIAITPSTAQKVCAGTSVTLTASGGSDSRYTWYKVNNSGTGDILLASNVTSYIVPGSLDGGGEYYATGYCNNNPQKSIKVSIDVMTTSIPSASADPNPATETGSTQFKGGAIGTSTPIFKWTGPNGFASTSQNPVRENLNKALHEGIYTLTLTESFDGLVCSNTSTVNLLINPTACKIEVGAYAECPGIYAKIDVTVRNIGVGQTAYYSIDNSNWQTSPTFNNLLGGIYKVNVKVGSGTQFCYAPEQEVIVPACTPTICANDRKLSYDRWDGIRGTEISSLTDQELTEIYTRKPNDSGYAPNNAPFYISNTETPYFVARVQGFICPSIANANYVFSMIVDNSARLYIDNEPVPLIDARNNESLPNGAGHLIPVVSNMITLSPGKHAIKVLYKQDESSSFIGLSWKIVDAAGVAITPNVLIGPDYMSPSTTPPQNECRIALTTTPIDLPSPLSLGDNFQVKATSETSTDTFIWTSVGPDILNSATATTGVSSKTVANDINVYILPSTKGTKTYTVTNVATGCVRTVKVEVTDSKCEKCEDYANGFQTKNPTLAQTFPKDRNYVIETTYLAKQTESGVQVVSYIDGLGRPMQKISIQQGPDNEDIVQPIKYDPFGREPIQYLAYPVANNKGNFVETATGIAGSNVWYKTNKSNISGDALPDDVARVETLYEISALNRPMAQSAPGVALYTTGTTLNTPIVTMDYGTNAGVDILKFRVEGTTAKIDSEPDETENYYPANSLFKFKTSDKTKPDAELITVEYKDKNGRLICKEEAGFRTYYIYNDLGQVACVIQPKAEDLNLLTGTFDLFGSAAINEFIFAYEYDKRGRVIRKKVPGAAAVTLSYTDDDLLLTTTESKNNATVVTTNIYDALNRLEQVNITIGGTTYTDVIHNYYDAYPAGSLDNSPNKTYNGAALEFASGSLKGLLVATSQKTTNPSGAFDANIYKSAMYYDKKHRLVQTVEQNHLGGKTYATNTLDFSGRTEGTYSEITNSSQTMVVSKVKTTYDVGSRPKTISQQMNSDKWQPIGEYTYNPIGEMTQKILGCRTQVVDYTYNIRGWLTGINNVPTGNSTTVLKSRTAEYDLFAMKLAYTGDGNISSQGYATAQKTGKYNLAYDIALTSNFTNTYLYDTQKRLTSSKLDGIAATPSADKTFYVTMQNYDANGNIGKLNRTVNGVQFDNLAYSYTNDGNQLKGILDQNGTSKYANTANYTYYTDGSLLKDDSKNLTMTYAPNALPSKIQSDAKNYEYIYKAGGGKLRTTAGNEVFDYIGNVVFKSKVDGTDRKIEFAGTAEGRWLPKEQLNAYNDDVHNSVAGDARYARYEYQLKDHLGNSRVACRCMEKALVTEDEAYQPIAVQENHYDAWGADINDDINKTTFEPPKGSLGTEHRYTYNGKELQKDIGLLEYGFRWYDPTIARFTSVDPLAEKFPELTTFQYASDNPVLNIDLDGLEGINAIMLSSAIEKSKLTKSESREQDKQVAAGVASLTDLNDATVIVTTITRKGNAINLDGSKASTSDKIFAFGGALIPFVAGAVISKGIDKLGDLFKGFNRGSGEGMEYVLKNNDIDLRGSGIKFNEALDKAFSLTGVEKADYMVTKWGRSTTGKSIPVEYRAPGGAEISLDYAHTNGGLSPDVPHIGWQTAGKGTNQKLGHIMLDEVPAGRTNNKLDRSQY